MSTIPEALATAESESTAARNARVLAWKAALKKRPRGALFSVGVRAPARQGEAPGPTAETAAPGSSTASTTPAAAAVGAVSAASRAAQRSEPSLIEGVPRAHDEEGLRLAVPGVSVIAIRWEDITSLRQLSQEETDDEMHHPDQVDTSVERTGDADSGG